LFFLEQVGDPVTGVPIGNSVDNLKSAIEGEVHEYTDMYPGYAKTAREEGFEEIADWFEVRLVKRLFINKRLSLWQKSHMLVDSKRH
jgi:rubrerythrin